MPGENIKIIKGMYKLIFSKQNNSKFKVQSAENILMNSDWSIPSCCWFLYPGDCGGLEALTRLTKKHKYSQFYVTVMKKTGFHT